VPRTFIGPLALHLLTGGGRLPRILAGWAEKQPGILPPSYPVEQVATRAALGLLVLASLLALHHVVRRRYGADVACCSLLLHALPFHLPFAATRPFPNTFALVGMNCAWACYLDGRPGATYAMFGVLVGVCAIFRCELLLLALPMIAFALWGRREAPSLTRAAGCIALAAGTAVLLTLTVDSWFWQRPLYWPEWRVFVFNVVRDGSRAYGTSPWVSYFVWLLPKIAGLSYPLALGLPLCGRAARQQALPVLAPVLAFVLAYSFLGEHRSVWCVVRGPCIHMLTTRAPHTPHTAHTAHIPHTRQGTRSGGLLCMWCPCCTCVPP
jgi:hypothetical protein